MDKTLVNHQIVSMRKLVKNARENQIRKMFKQINQIKKKIEKWQQLNDVEKDIKTKHLRKLNNRLQTKQKESKILKSLKPDTVSKYALVHKENELNKILNLSNSTIEERAISLLAKNKSVQANVKKFRNDNPGCEEWLPQQIELWEHGTKRKNKSNVNSLIPNPKKNQGNDQKKKEQQSKIITDSEKTLLSPIKEKPSKKSPQLNDNNKNKKDKNLNSSQTIYYTPNSSFKVSKINENDEEDTDEEDDGDEQVGNNKSKVQQTQKFESKMMKNNKKALIKRIDLDNHLKRKQDNILDDEGNDNSMDDGNFVSFDDNDDDERISMKNTKSKDKFFLSENGDEEEEEDDDLHKTVFKQQKNKDSNNKNQNKIENKKFSPNMKRPPKPRTPRYFHSPQNEEYGNDFKKDNSPKPKRPPNMNSNANLHPSWKAKLQAKQKERISISDQKPNKHIKFE